MSSVRVLSYVTYGICARSGRPLALLCRSRGKRLEETAAAVLLDRRILSRLLWLFHDSRTLSPLVLSLLLCSWSRFEIVFEGAGFEEVPLDETNLLVRPTAQDAITASYTEESQETVIRVFVSDRKRICTRCKQRFPAAVVTLSWYMVRFPSATPWNFLHPVKSRFPDVIL